MMISHFVFFLSLFDHFLTVPCVFQEFACNGTVVEHPEYGEVLQLQGDQRQKICDWLTKCGLVKAEQLKVHGF